MKASDVDRTNTVPGVELVAQKSKKFLILDLKPEWRPEDLHVRSQCLCLFSGTFIDGLGIRGLQ